MQRVDAKAQSALDLKKQNLKDESKKRMELVKSMEEVTGQYIYLTCTYTNCSHVKAETQICFPASLGQENARGERKRGF